jgi:tRNA-binding protein
MITWNDFEKLDIRIGTIISVEDFPKAKKPAYRLQIDFGSMGVRSSSAQITDLYETASLKGRQVVAVVNFPPRQIADFSSECLVLGVYSEDGVVLLQPERAVANGNKIG